MQQEIYALERWNYEIPKDLFIDNDGDQLTYKALYKNIQLSSDSKLWLKLVNGNLTGIPPANERGILTIILSAEDSSCSSQPLNLKLNVKNNVPQVVK